MSTNRTQAPRAVLIARRDRADAETAATAGALDTIASLGYHLIGVVDPADFRHAHRMIADGLAEVIVVVHMDYLPSVRVAGVRSTGQAMPVLRPASVAGQPGAVPVGPRTRLVDRNAPPPDAVRPPPAAVRPAEPTAVPRSQRRRVQRRSAA